MGNSILGKGTGNAAQPNQMLQQFNQFKQSFRGDPQQMVMEMVRSGKVSQAQLQEAIQLAKQLGPMLR